MPKNIDGVSLPERRRSIRNIPIPEGRRRGDRIPVRIAEVDAVKKTPSARPGAPLPEDEAPVLPTRHIRPGRGVSKRKVWLSVLVASALVLFGILSIFKGATLAYVPRSAQLSFAGETFSAYKSSGTGLLYSVVKLSGDKGTAVPATGETDVSRKASGTIIVYNDSSAEAQKFVATTRFQSTDGKVYRTPKDITVPGKTAKGPGSVEVVVTADVAGADSNIALTDFTLPGLKGTPRFDTVYARSKTPMTGGFVGKEKGVSAADLAKVKGELQAALSKELLAKAAAEVPEDFILFSGLSTVTFEDLPQTQGEGGNATVNLRGNLSAIMFKKTDFAVALSLGKAAVAAKDPVELETPDALQVSFAGGAPTDLSAVEKVDFKVSGQSLLMWKTDEAALKKDLAGAETKNLPQILKNHPTIDSATATVRPFWKSSFPTDPGAIVLKKMKTQ